MESNRLEDEAQLEITATVIDLSKRHRRFLGAPIEISLLAARSSVDQMNQLFKIDRSGTQVRVISDPKADGLSAADSLLCELNVDPYIALVHEHGLSTPDGNLSLAEASSGWAEAYAHDAPLPALIGAQCAKCEFKAPLGDALKCGHAECWKEANGCPTFYLHRHEAKPYHIDFVFAHEAQIDANPFGAQVGEATDWLALSDHMPIIVDL